MSEVRRHKISLFLNDAEMELWDRIRSPDLRVGACARIFLMERLRQLEKGKKNEDSPAKRHG